MDRASWQGEELGDGMHERPEPTDTRARILIAESQPDLRDELARVLGARWEIEAVGDGPATLAALARGSFDVIIADRALPGIDGLELRRRIRQRDETPLMIVSAQGDAAVDELDPSIDDYLVAPIARRDLLARVGVLLRLAAARREIARLLAAHHGVECESEVLRAMFMHAPAPIAVLRGPHHVVVLSNAAMAAAWGRRPNESVGRPLFEAIPEARARFQGVLDGVFTSGTPHVGTELAYRTEQAAGSATLQRYANVLCAPFHGPTGQVEGVCVIAVDITEEVRIRQETQRLRAEAEAANRAKDEFLAILGHELRNPLSPIATTLQMMRLRGDDTRELEVLERQVGHLTRLVDDLLDVSRAVRGKIELHRRDVELAEIVTEALEATSTLLEQRRHLVEVDVPQHGLGVHADLARLVQVVSNLLTNAAKYSDPGSRITIRGMRSDGKVRLSVRDRGIGITPEMFDRVFDLFVQQPQTIDRAGGGLGLGLPIVRSLVELHGGSVGVASEGGGCGSEFTIELPALARVATQPPAPVRSPEPAPAAHPRILVVDDNEDAAATLGEVLEHLGYEVAVAHDGPSALRLAATFEPAVALLDIGLPIMDGYELAERLRAQRAPGHGPHLIAVTGYGQESDRQQTARAGFERHLVKPVSLATLSEVVAELVR